MFNFKQRHPRVHKVASGMLDLRTWLAGTKMVIQKMNTQLVSVHSVDFVARDEATQLLIDLSIACGRIASILRNSHGLLRPDDSVASLTSAQGATSASSPARHTDVSAALHVAPRVLDGVCFTAATSASGVSLAAGPTNPHIAVHAHSASQGNTQHATLESAEIAPRAAAMRHGVEFPLTHDGMHDIISRSDGRLFLKELRTLSHEADTAAYLERIRPTLTSFAHPSYVVVALRKLVGVFDDEDSAVDAACDVRGEFLGALCVLRVGENGEILAGAPAVVHAPLVLPISVIPAPQVSFFPAGSPDVPAIAINVLEGGVLGAHAALPW